MHRASPREVSGGCDGPRGVRLYKIGEMRGCLEERIDEYPRIKISKKGRHRGGRAGAKVCVNRSTTSYKWGIEKTSRSLKGARLLLRIYKK